MKTWLKQYPAGVPAEVRTDLYPSPVARLEASLRKHHGLPACRFMGRALRFELIDDLPPALAAYLQSLGLARGDHVTVMLPSVPRCLVAVAAIPTRAGLAKVPRRELR